MQPKLFLAVAFSTVALLGCGQVKSVAPLPMSSFAIGNDSLHNLGTYTQLYEFQSGEDGATPEASLRAVGNLLYGTTLIGGDGSIHCGQGCGTIFTYNLSSGVENIAYRFKGREDGYKPAAALVVVNGKFYGTTVEGGSMCAADGCGTIFTFDPSSRVEKVLHVFKGGADGVYPNGLTAFNSQLYGTTAYGGNTGCIYNQGCGIIFGFDPSSGIEKVLYRFKGGKDGENSTSRLLAVNGKLYGTTSLGGGTCKSYGCGTIFKFDPTASAEDVVYRFKGGQDGQLPRAGLIAVKQNLYGTTYENGGCNDYAVCGTLFAYNLASSQEKPVHLFKGGQDGAGPAADLTAVNGKIYGTTLGGGENPGGCKNCGTIFSFDPSTGIESVRHRFNHGISGPNGLIRLDGTLYGTTSAGDGYSCGAYGAGCGTIFKFSP